MPEILLWCLIATVEALREDGVDIKILNGAGGSAVAQKTLIATVEALSEEGVDIKILNGAGGSAVAQAIMVHTVKSLRGMGFKDKQVEELIHGNNATAKTQRVIIESCKKLINVGFDWGMISTILAGNNVSNTKTIEIITKICLAKIADGVVHRDVLVHVTGGGIRLTRKRLVTEFERSNSK